MKRSIPAAALRRAMVARNWTATDLAREAGVDADTVTRALDDSRGLLRQTETKILSAIGQHPPDPDVVAAIRELVIRPESSEEKRYV
ncbi:MAG TPA: hypothetical protein VMU89_14035 [Thermomicrobiaceae bacterium]|nr:hypothetical protein [Thermomicrobiaceae bacterium]